MSRSIVSGLLVSLVLLLGTGPSVTPSEAADLAQRGGPTGTPSSNGGLTELQVRARGVFENPNVVFVDADERRGRLVIGVEQQAAAADVHARLRDLGVPVGAADVVGADPIYPLATLRDRVRPLRGGLEFQYFAKFPFVGYCTWGFNATRGGVAGFVINSHCTPTRSVVDGTLYYQSTWNASTDWVGVETVDPPFFGEVDGCPRRKLCRYSDSAFIAFPSGFTDSTDFTHGSIAQTTGLGSLELSPTSYQVVAEGVPQSGLTVNKVGRTTGWSQGQIGGPDASSGTCVDTAVAKTRIVLLCQAFVNAASGGGDSGSPVFEIVPGTTTVRLHGILWGGNRKGTNFIYSPIAEVQRSTELGNLSTCASGFSC